LVTTQAPFTALRTTWPFSHWKQTH